MPIAGTISPLDGIGRRNIPPFVAACANEDTATEANSVVPRNWRRVVMEAPWSETMLPAI